MRYTKRHSSLGMNLLRGAGSILEIIPGRSGIYGVILRSPNERHELVGGRIAGSLNFACERFRDEQEGGGARASPVRKCKRATVRT